MAATRHKPQGHGAGRGCAKSCLDIAIAPEAPRAIAFKRARKKTLVIYQGAAQAGTPLVVLGAAC